MLRRFVWSKNLVNEEAMAHWVGVGCCSKKDINKIWGSHIGGHEDYAVFFDNASLKKAAEYNETSVKFPQTARCHITEHGSLQ
jgi:hypothetical protein